MSDDEISKTLLKGPHAKMLDEAFGYTNSFWEYKPGRLILSEQFHEMAKEIKDAEVREDDVWVISYPKTGSTWLQEMVWLIVNDLDFDKAKNTIQQLRAPMIELGIYFAEYDDFVKKFGNSVEICNNWPSPRCVKSHLTYNFLPRQFHKVKPKVIYMTRHPKDLCVSYYHHCRMMYNVNVSFEDFAEMFLAGNVPIGNVFDHYLPYWQHREEMNLLFLKYEDFVRDPKKGIERLADFMERPLSAKDVERICDFLTIDNMRNNPGCNFESLVGSNLVRKGIVGDWKNYMDEALSSRFDAFIEKHLKDTGLSFDSD